MIVEGNPQLGLQKHQQDAYKAVQKAYENGNKATIITNDKSSIKVEEVSNKGISLGIKEITENDIKQVIFRK